MRFFKVLLKLILTKYSIMNEESFSLRLYRFVFLRNRFLPNHSNTLRKTFCPFTYFIIILVTKIKTRTSNAICIN